MTDGRRLRTLLVTPYPPSLDPLAPQALTEVRELRAAGHDVDVLSPAPSAARHHLDFGSPRAPVGLARRVRGYDRVVVELTPELLRPRVIAGMRVALAGTRDVELRVHDGELLARGGPVVQWAVRGLLRSATAVVADDAAARDRLIASAGVPASRARVRTVHDAGAAARGDGRHADRGSADAAPPSSPPWRVAVDAPADEIMAEIRARASSRRGTSAVRTAASAPLRRVRPLALPMPTSARPGASVFKRVVRRVTAWQLDPIVGQVNRLRDATVEALEARARDDEHP